MIRTARELNSADSRAGADLPPSADGSAPARRREDVFSGEGEVALALTEAILERLGATRDQIDRERTRVHSDLFS